MKPDVREAPISIRAKKSQRDLIDMAASLVSKSLTDFMLEVKWSTKTGHRVRVFPVSVF